MKQGAAASYDATPSLRFALAKFRPTALPAMLVIRSALHDRLTAGAGKRLTVVVGSAGAGKSVLLSSWTAARPPSATSWLSCDKADADPIRFWTGFIEAAQAVAPGFGADAACSETVLRCGPGGGARSGQRCHDRRRAPVTSR